MSITSETKLDKSGAVDFPVLDVIRKRWSPRAFDSRPVEQEKLLTVLEAARWAASSMNTQPWRFIIATRDNEAEFEKLLSVINEGNQAWAKDAPVLLLAVAKKHHDAGWDNRHAQHDVGQALAYLTLQATELDLRVRMMGGFDAEKAQAVYEIPDDFIPMTTLALGYQGTLEQLSEKLQERELKERTRKPLTELVFGDTWGSVSSLVK
ncbi:MAG: nitroreductase family protein [Chloroflexota bacterium]